MHRILEKLIEIDGGEILSVCESPHKDALFGVNFKTYLNFQDGTLIDIETGGQVSDEVHQEIMGLVEGYDE